VPQRILIVGIHDSPHVARWLDMIDRTDATVVVFPAISGHSTLPVNMRYISLADLTPDLEAGLWVVLPYEISRPYDSVSDIFNLYRRWRHAFLRDQVIAAPERLRECISRFRPALVHSMEVQLAGYLCQETARRMGNAFPPWLVSNWGSDIALFRKLPEHSGPIRKVCERMDYYMAECARDRQVARDFGYRGPALPAIPASGGIDVAALAAYSTTKPSARRKILIKGYHNWSGRALLALSAVVLAREHLDEYEIEVPVLSSTLAHFIEQLRSDFGLNIQAAEYLPKHDDAMARLAQARAVIGLGISDGISTTLLESMAVGAFPIQSSTACADEWIEHGRGGFIISPHDTEEAARAIIAAVKNDDLVDAAAEANLETIRSRWDARTNAARVWEIYGGVSARAENC
jgi:hypothetical protein